MYGSPDNYHMTNNTVRNAPLVSTRTQGAIWLALAVVGGAVAGMFNAAYCAGLLR